MSNDPFNSPASGKFEAKLNNGRLLLITPAQYLESVTTVNGTKDAVDGEVVVINEQAPAESEVISGARLFGGKLIAATKPFVGKGMVLGRLGQGTAKPGQNPPWELADATEQDKVAARAYLASKAPQL